MNINNLHADRLAVPSQGAENPIKRNPPGKKIKQPSERGWLLWFVINPEIIT